MDIQHGMCDKMKSKSTYLDDTQTETRSGNKITVEVPDIKDLKAGDILKSGNQRGYTFSVGALSVLDAVKEELKGTGEKLNDFVSEAIIYYSNARFSEDVLGKTVKAHNSGAVQPSEKKRIAALERLITIIGIDFLENKNQSEFNRMKKFLKNNPDIFEAGSLQETCKRASKEANLFADSKDMPLWLILFYANKFKFI